MAALQGTANAQRVDAYGYDDAGQYRADFGVSESLNLNCTIDVSELRAKFEQLYAPAPVQSYTSWSDDSDYDYSTSYYRPEPPPEPQLTPEQIAANQKAAELKALVDKANDALTVQKDYPLAVTLLQNAADAGDTASLATLYHLLVDKDKGVYDKARAAKLLVDLATGHDDYRDDKGNPVFNEFKRQYGQALIDGDGYPQDYDAGTDLVQKAAVHADAWVTLGREYEAGANHFHQSPAIAISCYQTSLLMGDHSGAWIPEIRSRMALLMIAQPGAGLRQYRDDLIGLLKPGDQSIPDSLRDAIGVKLYNVLMAGDPVPKNPSTTIGVLFMTKGAPDWEQAEPYFTNNDDPAAIRELARYYENGWGRPKDHQKAISMLTKAAAGGDKDAEYGLAVNKYEEARSGSESPTPLDGLAADVQKCAKALADAGNVPAKNNLAKWTRLRAEKSTTMTPAQKEAARKKAYELWTEAADQGVREATYYLAACDEYGIGATKDTDAAKRHYDYAAYWDDPQAQKRMGEITLQGLYDTPVDVDKGRHFLLMASYSLPSAAYELGLELKKGSASNDDLKQARDLFKQAFDAKIWQAGFELAACLHKGLGGDKDEAGAKALVEKAASMAGAKSAKIAVDAYTNGATVDPDPAMAAKWKALAGV
ncbi:hypothetical protein CCAX7_63380 [Capsulimonas corticalis]|uniref:Uncharacterized protein n=2 Tax=Capsulimonas corticalis TaxID=2219043 RepID=A0A402CWU9_9BACT|nr:hypothetical protein CCAX7_63380 [Capsulimonas corticalis]